MGAGVIVPASADLPGGLGLDITASIEAAVDADFVLHLGLARRF